MPYEIEIDPQKQNGIFVVKLMKDNNKIRHVELPLTATKEELEQASKTLITDQELKDAEEQPEPTPEEKAEQKAITEVLDSCVDVIEIGEKQYKVKKKYCQISEPIQVPPEEEPIEPESIKPKK